MVSYGLGFNLSAFIPRDDDRLFRSSPWSISFPPPPTCEGESSLSSVAPRRPPRKTMGVLFGCKGADVCEGALSRIWVRDKQAVVRFRAALVTPDNLAPR